MTTFFKVALAAIAVTVGTASVQADPVIDELARKGAIVTTQGILGPR